jgi:outer membrane protein
MTHAKTLLALAAAALLPTIASAADDAGNYFVRVRALYLQSSNTNQDDVVPLDLSINDKLLPELDLGYFFTPNIATELVLTYPQRQTISSGGVAIGSLKHLPPTLTVQYHFTGMSVRPYVGAGVNYTHFSDVQLPAGVSIKANSFGLAAQAGLDIPLGGGWMLNADLKYVQIKTDVSAGGVKVDTFKVDPWLYGVGIGYRF